MNVTIRGHHRPSHAVSARGRHRRRSPSRPSGFRPAIPPRLILHLLVGALAIISARAVTELASWPTVAALGDAPVAYADDAPPAAPGVSAPALKAGPDAPVPASRQGPRHADVLGDLSATIGQVATPATAAWRGVAGQDVNRRAAPNRARPPVGELKAGAPVVVVDWVAGEEVEPHNDTWAKLADGTYVFSTALRRSEPAVAPALPANAPASGRWIDVNLTEQIATAYDGRTALKSVLISAGRPGWDTPTGVFPILRRLEKDTMDGATLVGQGPNGAGASYKVENVRYVQYFTNDGAAIHENYWRRPATFGMPGSHGCIGMMPADAAWFWQFATVGTPLVIHD